ncbi:hypothetical protein VQH23_04650 [Pararoseomonas sp. SCSIO 73927]|uniref:hypothetical protein n=1 Tax=Pararoseomonas sp. SCSIO 73927 TaxID=3114537 RepID=UPI0030CA62F9
MGLFLYVVLKDAPFWLPSFLAWYFIVRGGPARRRWAAILWVPAVLLASLGPWAAGREFGDLIVMVLVAAALGGLMGFWQRRINPL